MALSILLVDDDTIEVEALRRALARARFEVELHAEENGREGLQRLRGEGGKRPPHAPCIVLLDIRMPTMNGLEFLAAVRADPQLRDTVVFMYTTSDSDADLQEAYQLGVAGYIVKSDTEDPSGLVAFLRLYAALVTFPHKRRGH